MRGRRALALAVALAAGQGCYRAGPRAPLAPVPRRDTVRVDLCRGAPCRGEVRLTSLGVAGFIIRAGSSAVMTAPNFTHPGVLRVMTPVLGRIHADTTEVNRQVHRLLGDPPDELRGVSAMLVGHGHYDHLMDVPFFARRYLPAATLYGSLTTKRLLMGDAWLRAHANQVDSGFAGDSVGTAWHVGRWAYTPDRGMRFMAVHTMHAPNFWFVTIAPGRASRDASHLPGTGWGWKMGEPLAWIVDVLDADGRPVFRVLAQDAAADPIDVLLPPFTGADRRDPDVVILCAGNFDNARDYPTVMLAALHPGLAIVAHWEDFFERARDHPRTIPGLDTRELRRRLNLAPGLRWIAPEPGVRVVVTY